MNYFFIYDILAYSEIPTKSRLPKFSDGRGQNVPDVPPVVPLLLLYRKSSRQVQP